MKRSHTEGSRKLICTTCGKEFKLSHHLKQHEITHIPFELREKKFECSYCKKRFTKNGHLSAHIQQVHSETKNFICHLCSKGFKRKHGLKKHIESTHATSADFPCPEPGCDIKCRSKSLLSAHIKVHAPKTFACPHCPKMFARIQGFKHHVYYSHTHADERPFKCDECDLSCKRKSDLKRHKLTHGPSDQFSESSLEK
jgi:uncharacterized Zn-finger protein